MAMPRSVGEDRCNAVTSGDADRRSPSVRRPLEHRMVDSNDGML